MKHNVYFGGAVQSLEVRTAEGRATVGVITPGRYRFDAEFEEHVKIITGTLSVTLPEQRKQQFGAGETYVVPRNSSFEVEANDDVSYICCYR
jgi:uncharacterized protein YaiE (UPF0345 family)